VVSFLIAGTQKGGTTALHSYLSAHPGLYLPPRKELHFFDNDKAHSKPSPPHRSYERRFRARKPGQIAGEATPIYMFWPEASQRIFEYNPQMKLIVSLRNPIERAFSHWTMETRRRLETRDFYTSITADAGSGLMPTADMRVKTYVSRGRYAGQLRRLFDTFGRDQVLVLRQERLRADPNAAVSHITRFLGVHDIEVSRRDVFSTSYASSMSAREWSYLHDVFQPEIAALEQLLDWDFSDWLQPMSTDITS
jgi:hypothetical protein